MTELQFIKLMKLKSKTTKKFISGIIRSLSMTSLFIFRAYFIYSSKMRKNLDCDL